MKLTMRMMVAAIAAGIAGVGALALMSPAVADVVTQPVSWAAGNGDGTGLGYGRTGAVAGDRDGSGRGPGTAGQGGMGAGDCLIAAEQGTLTDAQRDTLAALAQEEKLAHDLYVTFDGKYQVAVFDRIAGAEERHLAMLRTLMGRYQVTDPTAGQATGRFTDPAVQATYDRLLADGSRDAASGYAVGRTVEQADIDDLGGALDALSAPDARQVYASLLTASRHHLTSFDAWSKR